MTKIIKYIRRAVKYILYGQPQVVNVTNANIVMLQRSELLLGRTALVTGGTSGIGLAIADAFLAAGANVVLTSRTQDRANVSAEKLQGKYPERIVVGVALDNLKVETFDDVVSNIIKRFRIDILVNNAGSRGGRWGDFNKGEYDLVMDTNLRGAFFLSEIVAKYMIQEKIHGNILNICSASSLRPANSAYCLSKAGLRAFTIGLAKTLIPYDIVVNGIAPGPTATPMFDMDSDSNIANSSQPNNRYTTVEEIATMAVVYVSNMGRSIVGDIAYMTGGAAVLTFDDNSYAI